MSRDPFIREKYTREVKTARAVAREYFERFPKDRYETSVESWWHLQCDNYDIHHEAVDRRQSMVASESS